MTRQTEGNWCLPHDALGHIDLAWPDDLPVVGRAQQSRRRDWSVGADLGDHSWFGGAVYWAQSAVGIVGVGVCLTFAGCASQPPCGSSLQGRQRHADAFLKELDCVC